jgi:hypothetical protein
MRYLLSVGKHFSLLDLTAELLRLDLLGSLRPVNKNVHYLLSEYMTFLTKLTIRVNSLLKSPVVCYSG